MTIDRNEIILAQKTLFSPDKMQKQGIKSVLNMADKHPHIPRKSFATDPDLPPLPHPGVRGSYTRVSSSYSSRFWQKKSLSWWKNEAILTCSAPIPGRSLFFIVIIDIQYVIVFHYDGYDRWIIV